GVVVGLLAGEEGPDHGEGARVDLVGALLLPGPAQVAGEPEQRPGISRALLEDRLELRRRFPVTPGPGEDRGQLEPRLVVARVVPEQELVLLDRLRVPVRPREHAGE